MPITYLLLIFSIVLSLTTKSQKLIVASIVASSAAAFYEGIADVVALLGSGGFLLLVWAYFKLPQSRLLARGLWFVAMVACAAGFFCHYVPGFNNLLYLNQVRLAPDSYPYTMYLNFDKVLAALILCSMSFLYKEDKWLNYAILRKTLLTLLLCIITLMAASLTIGYVKFDYKLSQYLMIWSVNNLLFVCFAEEVLFRGIIQNTLLRQSVPYWLALLITSSLFGMYHFQGGPMYILLSTAAGLFYGYAYHRTGRIFCGMLVHFGLNLCHFVFFSYPALVR